MKMTLTDAGARANEEPRVSACMFHRCIDHMAVPALNESETSGAECGACIAVELHYVEREQLWPVLDAFGARLVTSSIYKSHIQKCIDRLNFLQPGAGDGMLEELATDYQKQIIRRRQIEARYALALEGAKAHG